MVETKHIYLNNALLITIVARLAWGESEPHEFSVLPQGLDDVADAAIIVSPLIFLFWYISLSTIRLSKLLTGGQMAWESYVCQQTAQVYRPAM